MRELLKFKFYDVWLEVVGDNFIWMFEIEVLLGFEDEGLEFFSRIFGNEDVLGEGKEEGELSYYC